MWDADTSRCKRACTRVYSAANQSTFVFSSHPIKLHTTTTCTFHCQLLFSILISISSRLCIFLVLDYVVATECACAVHLSSATTAASASKPDPSSGVNSLGANWLRRIAPPNAAIPSLRRPAASSTWVMRSRHANTS